MAIYYYYYYYHHYITILLAYNMLKSTTLPVEIMHRKACITRYLVQAMPT